MARFAKPRFLVRTILIVTTWTVGAVFAAQVPDEFAQRRAEELAPVAPSTIPAQQSTPTAHPDSRPGEAPPLIDPPSPTPA